MKKVGYLVLLVNLVLGLNGSVFAQDADFGPTPWDTAKEVVDLLDPAIEYGVFVGSWDVGDAEGFTGLSGALYTLKSQDLSLFSVRAGVALQADHAIYLTGQANGINIIKRYASDDVKAFLSPGPMGSIWDFLGEYGKLGIGPAYHVEREQFGVVGTIGGTVKF